MSIATHLGQTSTYVSTYNPHVLVTEQRQTNRDSQNINSDMTGYDIWNIYEVSFITKKGLPVNGYGKLVYSADNMNIVESKSLKLYFFSFNMTEFGDTVEEAIENMTATVTLDLSRLLNTPVKFTFFPTTIEALEDPYTMYETIDNGLDFINFSSHTETPSLLHASNVPSTAHLTSSLLRSNCKITNQPDYGDVFIYYSGPKTLDTISLAQYLVSFRSENHFHEEVCEMIYDRLYKLLTPAELMVTCRYTRRGGIDINPVRASSKDLLYPTFIDSQIPICKLARQ